MLRYVFIGITGALFFASCSGNYKKKDRVTVSDTTSTTTHSKITTPSYREQLIEAISEEQVATRRRVHEVLDSLDQIGRQQMEIMTRKQREDYLSLSGALTEVSNDIGREYYNLVIEELETVSGSLRTEITKVERNIQRIQRLETKLDDIFNGLGKIIALLTLLR